MRIETARLVIRTFEPRDAEPWIAMVSDPDVTRFLPPGPVPTLEVFQNSMERRHTIEREHGYAVWAVDGKESGTFIGQCGFLPPEGTEPEVELAYHYIKAAWHRGYATEALIAVLTHGLGPVGLDHVMGLVVPENVGSWRAMENAGMRFEGTGTYYDYPGLKKYVAERAWWSPPQVSP
jgi:[ribosomal protein S5]-alanine N-acetyltransferase